MRRFERTAADRLHSLELSGSILASADLLVQLAPAFAHLAWIGLDENHLTDARCERILAVLPTAKLSDQRLSTVGVGEDEEAEETQRYVALGE